MRGVSCRSISDKNMWMSVGKSQVSLLYGCFLQKTIVQTRNNCHQMSTKELNLVIMSQLNALRTHVDDKPSSSGEFRPITKYLIHGIAICQKMFCFLTQLGNIVWRVYQHGSQEMVSLKGCIATPSTPLTMQCLLSISGF